MAGLTPNYGSGGFGQYGSSGSQAYGFGNAPMGYGQGYNGLPMGYMGMFGGTPTGYNTTGSNTAKMRTNAPGGTQAPGAGGGPASAPGSTTPGGHHPPNTSSGGGGDKGSKSGGGNGNGLPWQPWHHDYSNGQMGGGAPGHAQGGGVHTTHDMHGTQSGKPGMGNTAAGGHPGLASGGVSAPYQMQQNPFIGQLLSFLGGGQGSIQGGNAWSQRGNV